MNDQEKLLSIYETLKVFSENFENDIYFKIVMEHILKEIVKK